MQDKKRFKDQHPAVGPRLEGALGLKVKKEQWFSKGLLKAMHDDRGKMKGKNKSVVKLR